MTQTKIHRTTAFLKNYLPSFMWRWVRGLFTALLTPIRFSLYSGHLRSSLRAASVNRKGSPIPWYTYPAIDFLLSREFSQKEVLEFGGGHSTLWWAERAKWVITFEEDLDWFSNLSGKCPSNVDLIYMPLVGAEVTCQSIRAALKEKNADKFDIIVIDGLYRCELIEVAVDYLRDGGLIICDNGEGYGFFEGFKGKGFSRIDFYGYAPGVYLPHVTSLYFRLDSEIFDSNCPIRVPALD